MKIVQINAVYEFSSIGRSTTEMHHFLKSNGHDSFVFCSNYCNVDDNVYIVGSNFDHKLHALLSRISGKQAFFSNKATKRILLALDKIHPDIVILRNLHANYINLEILLSYFAERNIPTIIVLHDCWLFTGHCTHYTAHKCYKWQKECYDCELMKLDNPSLFIDTSNWMFHKKKELFDAIPRLGVVGVSDWITNEAKKSVILKNAKQFQRIYNWIDLDKFYPRDVTKRKKMLGINNEFVVLGVAQKWTWRKGLSHFIEVAQRLPDVKFVLIGEFVNEKLRKSLPINVLTPGATSCVEELAEYYSLADTLLVCSLQETFGKVSAEALACGTPVIANKTTANTEIVGSEWGISIDNNDYDQIVNAIRHIITVGKVSYSDKCIERTRKDFESNKQLKKYVDFFYKITKIQHTIH